MQLMPPVQLKRTPFYEKHLQLGAKMVPFAGWEMPVYYPRGIIAEHLAVRSGAGLFDIAHMGLIKLEGDGALQIIQNAATNDASLLSPNQCQYSTLCNEAGGVIDDILVYRLPTFYLIIANAVNADRVVAWLKNIPGNSSIGFYDEYCSLSVQGPKALPLVERALSLSLAELKRNHTAWWRDIIVSRTGYTGEDGCELIVAKDKAASLWDSLIELGAQPCGLGARDTLRLEAGLPLYGHEYDENTSPLEAGYGWAVKLDKGAFIGRAALLQEKQAGLKKKLVGVEMASRAIPRQGNIIYDAAGAGPIGRVTSGTFSPTLKKPIALAYLTAAAPDVLVEIRGEKLPGKVVDKAFYKGVK
jgi:aminomethyltransferase